MATPPASTEASEIRRRGRRRLVGAIAIVVLLVVFVPMILDSGPRPTANEPVLAIPPKDNAPPLPSPAPAKTAEPAAPSHAPAPPPKTSMTPAPAAPSKASVAPAPAPPKAVARATSPPAVVKAPPVRLEGFAVQVGAFHDEAKLREARERLAAAGVAHYTERLDTSSGELTRLRAGPFPTRAAAEAALAKLRKQSLDGQVVPLP